MYTYNEICAVLNEYEEARNNMNKARENKEFSKYDTWIKKCIVLADTMCLMLDEIKFSTLNEEERKEIEED